MNIQTAVDRLTSQLPLKARQLQLAPELKHLHQCILQSLVTRGAPPTHAEIAALVGETEVINALRILDSLDLAVLNPEASAVLGAYPLTIELTPHRLSIGSQTIYAMCALDALSVSPMFATQVRIDSHCLVSGEPVHIDMRGKKVLVAIPQQVMIGIRWQMPCGAAAHSMCTEMVFLKDKATARQWQSRDRENISLFSLADAVELAAAFFTPLVE